MESKIQKYSIDGKELIETYNNIRDAVVNKENNRLNIAYKGIIKSIESNSAYKKFRWAYLDASLPNETIQHLVETYTVNLDYIAMLNLEKNKIEKVFLDKKEVAKNRKSTGVSTIVNSIKRETPSKGNYFMFWYSCSNELKDEYLQREKLPVKEPSMRKVIIEQIDPKTDEIIKIIPFENVIKEIKISRKSLRLAIQQDIVVKGFKWRRQ